MGLSSQQPRQVWQQFSSPILTNVGCGQTEGCGVLDYRANICSPARPCRRAVLMSLSQRLLLNISGQEEAEHRLKSEEKNPLSVLKPQTPQCVSLLNILPTAS